MDKVYITQDMGYSAFRQCEEWGELVFITVRRDEFVTVGGSGHNELLASHIRSTLRDFDPATDWILLCGSPYIQAAVMWWLGKKQFRKIQFLRWDNRALVYVPLILEMDR